MNRQERRRQRRTKSGQPTGRLARALRDVTREIELDGRKNAERTRAGRSDHGARRRA